MDMVIASNLKAEQPAPPPAEAQIALLHTL